MKKQKWLKRVLILSGILLLIAILNYEVLTRDSWSNWSLPLSGKIIVIDPGHGGPDGGAESNDIKEKDIALDIAHNLEDLLQEAGALVMLTRESDKDLADEGQKGLSRRKAQDLQRRVDFIKNSDADAVISIHLNAIPSSRWRGAQTFFYPKSDKNKALAKFIQDSLRNELKNTDRVAKAIDNLFILKRINPPSALVEVGFLSNAEERQQLNTDDYQHKVAAAIYQGVMRFFTKEPVPDLE